MSAALQWSASDAAACDELPGHARLLRLPAWRILAETLLSARVAAQHLGQNARLVAGVTWFVGLVLGHQQPVLSA